MVIYSIPTGDNGNVLMIKYVGEKLGAKMTFDIVSVGDDFDKDHYDMVFFGGGQDYEQSIVAKDLPSKRDAIGQFIQDNKVILSHLWWFPTSWTILHPG